MPELVKHQNTLSYAPRVAKRMIRSIIKKARILLWIENLSKKFLGRSSNTVVYLNNQSPKAVIYEIPVGLWIAKSYSELIEIV